MHKIIFTSAILLFSCLVFSQTLNDHVSANDRWNLDKYVWSHAHYETSTKGKQVLDFDAIDNWTGIGSENDVNISPNGKYFAYGIKRIVNNNRDSFIVQSTTSSWRRSFEGEDVRPGFFSADSKQYIFQDKEGLCFLQLSTGELRNIKGLLNYNLTAANMISRKYQWLAYQLPSKEVVLQDLITGKEKRIENVSAYNFDKTGEWLVCQLNNANNELLLYNLTTEEEKHFLNVAGYLFDQSSKILLLKTVDGSNTSLQHVNLADGATRKIWSSSNENIVLRSYTIDNTGNQVVFVIKNDNDTPNGNSIWYWKKGMNESVQKLNDQTAGINKLLFIQSSASFTRNGKYVYFSLQSPPDLRKAAPDAVKLDVWSYKDNFLQSSQPYLSDEPSVYSAVLNLETDRVMQLEKQNEKLVFIAKDFAVIKKLPNRSDRFWEEDFDRDNYFIVSLEDGTRRLLPAKKIASNLLISPKQNYLVYADTVGGGNYFSYNLNTGKSILMSSAAMYGQVLYKNESLLTKEKLPSGKFLSKQILGWVGGDSGFLVSDNYDIWQLDPSGKKAPINITNGYGRLHRTQFYLSDFGGWHYFSSKDTLLLGAFNKQNKSNGFYRKVLGVPGNPEELYMGPCFFYAEGIEGIDNNLANGLKPQKAASADVWLVQRQTSAEAPNHYLTTDFKNFKPLTNLQPQKKFNWPKAELHSFKDLDGLTGDAILYKSQNFDASKKYPVLIVLYDQFSNRLNIFPKPQFNIHPIILGLSPNFFSNDGYLIFAVDIKIQELRYGPKALSVIEGAIKHLKTLSYVDSLHIGAASHSWSAKLGSYVYTHSKNLAAMVISEGLFYGNIINAALSLDEGKGESELKVAEIDFDFGNFWENKATWLDQTTVLNIDKATTPLLLYCGKKSSAEYQNQTVQLFTALRRTKKRAWWLNYYNSNHNLMGDDAKDITIRTMQFYDHYLKKAPGPKWLTNGLPHKLNGIESRLELDPSGSCALPGKECTICKAWNAQHKRTPELFDKPISEWKLDDDLRKQMEREESKKLNKEKGGGKDSESN